jgi:hypothetical protein
MGVSGQKCFAMLFRENVADVSAFADYLGPGRGFLIRVAIRDWCVTLDEVRHVPGGIRNVEKAVEGVSQLGLSCFNFGGTHGLGLAEREIIAAFWQVKTAVEVMCRGGYA